jgi:hypothetical protein
MQYSYPVIFIPHISIPVMFIFLLIILLGILLLSPFNLSLNIGKKGPLVWGSIKLAWFGLTLRKLEISPQSADDLLASIRKEETEREERAVDESKTRGRETAAEKKNEPGGKKDREQTDNETTDTTRHPSVRSLIDAAPDLAKILWDLLKSIHFKKSSCRLCFGLNDPAHTAIVSGYLWFLASALGTFSANISIDPWFDGERLEGEIIAEIEARLLWPVFAVIKALRVREIRLLLKEMLGWT